MTYLPNVLGGLATVAAVVLFMYCVIYAAAKLSLRVIRWADQRDARDREARRQAEEAEIAQMRHAAIRAWNAD